MADYQITLAETDVVQLLQREGGFAALLTKVSPNCGTVTRGNCRTLRFRARSPVCSVLLPGFPQHGPPGMPPPSEHWRSVRTNNPLERLNREIRRRTRVVGCFFDGRSAVMLVTARLRYLAGQDWGTKRYLNMQRLWDADPSAAETS